MTTKESNHKADIKNANHGTSGTNLSVYPVGKLEYEF